MNTANNKKTSSWIDIIRRYNQPDNKKSIWQIINSLGGYIILWAAMYYSLGISYWITLGLAPIAAGFMVRLFIIFHDCGHGSFFKSDRANRIVGIITGSLAWTPYDRWHKDHSIHHNTVGNLDKRGIGDVWTVTVDEYESMSKWKKFNYRVYRHPLILFGIGPFLLFVLWFRFNKKEASQKERRNTHLTNLILTVIVGGLILLMGWKAYLMIMLPITFIGTSAGTWLFYVQHQFEDVVWEHDEQWNYKEIALQGSSFLKAPKLLQWFSGNIGFHHVHHLGPKIPNYNLERCHKENTIFSSIKPVTLIKGIQTMKFKLWNEDANRLITFRQFRKATAG